MNFKLQLVLAFMISVICIVGFSLISLLISDHKIISFDQTVIANIQGMESPRLTSLMKLLTFIGSTPFVIILSIGLIFFLYKVLHHRLELILFIGAIIGTGALNDILKHVFHRTRPHLHRLIEATGYSFPSGHAMSAFSVYVMITFLLWRHIPSKWGRSLLIIFSTFMILGIGISRIYLGVHYPSDIIGGYLASGFWLTVAIWFFQYYKEKSYNKRYNRGK
ncbi:phosphatase PAP2 family protein [Bacillus sp. BRMEA1]|uniref:phosphatase PAP2 family protein n=1 Tax=Neobacillus endophyticus TaxID=2738405 RepID=UPI00156655E2|nr:phosphatase PAP2 family protein [Neobacillus endophyticus]NRD79300.1 phosphatase PAP2 family protein [Neobacillus endophyticus]